MFFFGVDRATGDGVEFPGQMAQPESEPIEVVDEVVEEVGNDDFYAPLFEGEFNCNYASSDIPTPPSGFTPTGSTPHVFTPSGSMPTAPTPPVSARRTSLPTSAPRSSTPPANTGTKKGKKRSRMADGEALFASMDKVLESQDTMMTKLVSKMGYAHTQSDRRAQCTVELEKLDIEMVDRFKLCAFITDSDARVDNFLNCKDHEKQAWVEAVLAGKAYGPI